MGQKGRKTTKNGVEISPNATKFSRTTQLSTHPPDLLVLAGEDDLAAVPVEGGGEDKLRQGKVDQALSCPNVPHADVVVRAAGEEDVLS